MLNRSAVLDASKNALDWNFAKDKLYVIVRNAKNVPYGAIKTQFEDLALTYHVELEEDGDEHASLVVGDGLLKAWGVSQEELHEIAIENCKRTRPELLESLNVMVGFPDFGPTTVVITNTKCMYGAACLFYPGVIERLAKTFNGDFVVLPSSVHEVIAVPAENVDDLIDMVRQINQAEVSPSDRLSDNVYRYYSNENKLKMVA